MSIARLEKLRRALTERGMDAILISKPENRAYMSGFTGSNGWLLIDQAHAYLITDFRYTEQAAAQAPAYEIIKIEGIAEETLAARVKELGVKNLGIEGDFVSVDVFRRYEEVFAGVDLVGATNLVETLRQIKDEDEIAIMRRAAAITDEAWSQLIPLIKPGATERDLALELEYRMKKLGAEGLAFEIICASGVRSSLPHGRASEKVVEKGDLLTFDFGAAYGGYCSDMTRTVMVGEPSAKQREIYEIVLEAQMRGVAACRPGMNGKELDEVCRGYIREKGYAEYFGHGTGHAVGRYIHESPTVSSRGEKHILQPGMVVTIEPGIYLPGWGGVRIEDTVLVTANGCERLTNSPKELLVL